VRENSRPRKRIALSHLRWSSYALAAGATTAGALAPAEAEIHYSGPVNYVFRGRGASTGQWHSFPLSNGAHLWGGTLREAFASYRYAYFGLTGAKVSNSMRRVPGRFGVAALPANSTVSQGSFFLPGQRGIMQGRFCSYPDWQDRGTYYVGFRFGNGAGAHYGWVRIRWSGCPADHFVVKDYAWGDTGDQIKTGQRRLKDSAAPAETSDKTDAPLAPAEGSIGLLALGAVGLLEWRKSRRAG
jgi:hypothetical protein